MAAEILVATPCYGGSITNTYFTSVLKTIAAFNDKRIANLHFYTVEDSLVTRARNTCVAMFLRNSTYTHLMFIDNDIGFEPENIARLLEKDEPFVCSPYPIKKYQFNRIKDIDPSVLNTLSDKEIVARLLKYNVHVSSKMGPYSRTIHNGFMEIDRAGTGFMLIRREVIERMMLKYPNLKYKSHDIGEKEYEDYLWRLFDCEMDEDNCYLSEDFTFCDRWRKIGGKIWMDITAQLTHTGVAHYRGDMMQVMNIGKREDS